jgi:hypothetical protein
MGLRATPEEAEAMIAERLESHRRRVALDRAAEALRYHPEFREALVDLAAAEREEEEARRIAAEYRRRQRILDRAEQILEEGEEV